MDAGEGEYEGVVHDACFVGAGGEHHGAVAAVHGVEAHPPAEDAGGPEPVVRQTEHT